MFLLGFILSWTHASEEKIHKKLFRMKSSLIYNKINDGGLTTFLPMEKENVSQYLALYFTLISR